MLTPFRRVALATTAIAGLALTVPVSPRRRTSSPAIRTRG